jgi:hypothetical protein
VGRAHFRSVKTLPWPWIGESGGCINTKITKIRFLNKKFNFWVKIRFWTKIQFLENVEKSPNTKNRHRLDWNERFETIRMKRSNKTIRMKHYNETKPNSGFSCQYLGKFKKVLFHYVVSFIFVRKWVWICLNIDTKTLNLVSFHYVVSFLSFHPLCSIRAYGKKSDDLEKILKIRIFYPFVFPR